jgi:hypothetical protein
VEFGAHRVGIGAIFGRGRILAEQFRLIASLEKVRLPGRRHQLVPLIPVMRIGKLARISALAQRLDFDKTNQRVADGDGIVRARLEVRKRRLANEVDRLCREAADLGKVVQQSFERPAPLIFGRAAHRDVA